VLLLLLGLLLVTESLNLERQAKIAMVKMRALFFLCHSHTLLPAANV
jgi:hypothetical protein